MLYVYFHPASFRQSSLMERAGTSPPDRADDITLY
jgi:hypothetical protein